MHQSDVGVCLSHHRSMDGPGGEAGRGAGCLLPTLSTCKSFSVPFFFSQCVQDAWTTTHNSRAQFFFLDSTRASITQVSFTAAGTSRRCKLLREHLLRIINALETSFNGTKQCALCLHCISFCRRWVIPLEHRQSQTLLGGSS